MRKIVKEILETESKIGEILQQARQKASEMRLAADKEASEQIGDARQEARGIVQAAVEEAAKESEQIQAQTLRQADQQAHALFDGKTDVIEDLVTRLCAIVLNVGSEMDGQ
ncbi:MAG: hypothetical protein ABFD90_17760 [Phycisphaerales bacterium]